MNDLARDGPGEAHPRGFTAIMTTQPGSDPIYPSNPTTPLNSPSGSVPPPGWNPSAQDGSGYGQQPAGYGAPQQQNAWTQNMGSFGGNESLTPSQERNWGMLAHLIPAGLFVLSAGTLGFFASLAIYLMYKDRGPFVRAHAANSLNLQIVTGIGLIVSAILMLVLIGFVTYPLICIFAVVVHLIGASKASSGQWYDPPMVPKIIR